MRFRSNGGTRPDDVGAAPGHWGLSAAQYREKADVWPLNPRGELVAMAIVESELGLQNLKEIAAVPGLGSLIVGAGTLRGVFRSNPDGFELAVQSILAACKANNIACGYPTNEGDMEARMKEGWTVNVIQTWGGAGFRAVEIGRRVGGRN
jgi:4-hydroxy-2-oxoheptanedioate aldolase